jgi:hypothetical protein
VGEGKVENPARGGREGACIELRYPEHELRLVVSKSNHTSIATVKRASLKLLCKKSRTLMVIRIGDTFMGGCVCSLSPFMVSGEPNHRGEGLS